MVPTAPMALMTQITRTAAGPSRRGGNTKNKSNKSNKTTYTEVPCVGQ
jgi:hypothetical protein